MSDDLLTVYDLFSASGGWRDRSDRCKWRIAGPDSASFLQAVLSNDVAGLAPGRGTHAALLSSSGKIVSDFYLYRLEDCYFVDVDQATGNLLREGLGNYIIMEEVTIDELEGDLIHLSIEGASASEIVASVFGVVPLPATNMIQTVTGSLGGGWIIRRDELSSSGVELLLPSGSDVRSLVMEWIREHQVVQISEGLFEVLRLEQGRPRFGTDYSSKNNPVEVQLSSAYSLGKGCYPGQEVVSKATYVGGPARLLVRFQGAAGSPPASRLRLFDLEGRDVGWVSSSVDSPRFGRSIGLGWVKRDKARPGTSLRAGSDGLPLEVVGSFE